MNTNPGHSIAPRLEGNLMRLGEHRLIAIYLRDGTPWVAEFNNGRGEVFSAGAWFSLNRGNGVLAYAQRRTAQDNMVPLPAEIATQIERLHCDAAMPSNNPAGVAWAYYLSIARSLSDLVWRMRCSM